MMRQLLLLVCLALALASCFPTGSRKSDSLGGFDLSSDDRIIIFSAYRGGVSSIFAKTDALAAERVVAGSLRESYFNPAFSPDGVWIAFIGAGDDQTKSRVLISHADGTELQVVFEAPLIVTELAFDSEGSSLFFIGNRIISSPSGFSPRMPHGADIYVASIAGKTIHQLTHLNAYALNGLCLARGKLYFREVAEQSGMRWIAEAEDQGAKVEYVEAPSGPRPNTENMYQMSWSEPRQEFAFIVPYEIYAVSADLRSSRLILRPGHKQIMQVRCSKTKEDVLFSVPNEDILYRTSPNGSFVDSITLF